MAPVVDAVCTPEDPCRLVFTDIYSRPKQPAGAQGTSDSSSYKARPVGVKTRRGLSTVTY